MTTINKTTNDKSNTNYDCMEHEYKIYMVRNVDTKDFYISYTKQKYLCRVLGNMKRKKESLTFAKLFSTPRVKIDLLEIFKSDNLFEVQERITEITKDYTTSNQEVYDTKNEYKLWDKEVYTDTQSECGSCNTNETNESNESNETNESNESSYEPFVAKTEPPPIKKVEKQKKQPASKEDKKCDCCNLMISYTNWARHLKTKSHIKKFEK
jgi:hypothetical protein